MPQFEFKIEISRPVSAVFAYVADLTRWPEWRLALSRVDRLTSGPLGVGSRFSLAGQAMGREVAMEVEVTDFVPDERLAFRLASGQLSGQAGFHFQPLAGGAQVTVSGAVEFGGLLKLATGLATRQMEQMWQADLAALKAILEGESASGAQSAR